ncbi:MULTISPECIES: hypothetical protein [Rhizobium]|jgi:NAD(P)-dependent dehydrogenase (short-subunit alcohol dehydrogenase family)|uniref:hypothetical protein n=1 Tax=Rhizobium TaxID=379 RepID=UPI000B228368|nr:hypothetical protein [Rhizobium lusitanum]
MPLDLAGRTIVVSGAAGGMGRAVVSKLAATGARVCATDLSPTFWSSRRVAQTRWPRSLAMSRNRTM